MSNIVNLNKAKKQKLKVQKALNAESNRLIFGISTKVRKVNREQVQLTVAKHSQLKRDINETNKNS
jgi:hypothetical protein